MRNYCFTCASEAAAPFFAGSEEQQSAKRPASAGQVQRSAASAGQVQRSA